MRWVPAALTSPSRCAVLPYIGRDHPDGFFDTGSELPGKGDQFDCHVYVSVVAAREMARELGWMSPEDVADLKEQLEVATALAEAMAAERDEAKAVLGAVDLIESEGFRARKKPGRPKAEKAPA